jgi:hypothetical protein
MYGLHHLFLYVKECVGNLNVTEEVAPYAEVLINHDGSIKWHWQKKQA